MQNYLFGLSCRFAVVEEEFSEEIDGVVGLGLVGLGEGLGED